MAKVKNVKISKKRGPDVNGNNSKTNVGAIKDQIVTPEGRVLYPCRFCNKVFSIRKSRTDHIKNCPAKDYILTIGEGPHGEEKPPKIDVQQNVLLPAPPIKLTIRRSPTEPPNAFAVVLKEKNESDEFGAIAKRLENNAVTITKQVKEEEERAESETVCRECAKEFGSPLELLRHSRNCHSYPKVMMAMSEVKKFYNAKERTECPICRKPLKTSFRSAFIKHLHTHTNEMKHCCSVCNKKFRRLDHMKAHERRHIVKDKK